MSESAFKGGFSKRLAKRQLAELLEEYIEWCEGLKWMEGGQYFNTETKKATPTFKGFLNYLKGEDS